MAGGGLADKLLAQPERKGGRQFAVPQVITDADDRDGLKRLHVEHGWTAYRIGQRLKAAGFDISENAVRNWLISEGVYQWDR